MTECEGVAGRHRLDMALGLNIRQRRKALGLSQTALAQAVGLTFQQIQKYERGANRVSFSRLVDIAHALHCRVVDLIDSLDGIHGAQTPSSGDNVVAMREPSGVELLAAYAKIPADLRRAVLRLVLEMAKDNPAGHASADTRAPRVTDREKAQLSHP